MAAEVKKEAELEIAHVLFIDIVGYSKLSINEQNAAVDELTQIVRSTEQFQKAEASDRLITKPWIGELRRDLRYQALAKAGLFLEPNASSVAR
jgi:hypothetical protein